MKNLKMKVYNRAKKNLDNKNFQLNPIFFKIKKTFYKHNKILSIKIVYKILKNNWILNRKNLVLKTTIIYN